MYGDYKNPRFTTNLPGIINLLKSVERKKFKPLSDRINRQKLINENYALLEHSPLGIGSNDLPGFSIITNQISYLAIAVLFILHLEALRRHKQGLDTPQNPPNAGSASQGKMLDEAWLIMDSDSGVVYGGFIRNYMYTLIAKWLINCLQFLYFLKIKKKVFYENYLAVFFKLLLLVVGLIFLELTSDSSPYYLMLLLVLDLFIQNFVSRSLKAQRAAFDLRPFSIVAGTPMGLFEALLYTVIFRSASPSTKWFLPSIPINVNFLFVFGVGIALIWAKSYCYHDFYGKKFDLKFTFFWWDTEEIWVMNEVDLHSETP